MILFEDTRSWWRRTKTIRAEEAILSNLPRAEIDTGKLARRHRSNSKRAETTRRMARSCQRDRPADFDRGYGDRWRKSRRQAGFVLSGARAWSQACLGNRHKRRRIHDPHRCGGESQFAG